MVRLKLNMTARTIVNNEMIIPSFYTLEQCDRVTLQNNTMPYVKSYYSCLNRLIGDGYDEDFQFSPTGIQSKKTKRVYGPGEFKVINLFRFEGSGNEADNVLLYMLETSDGLKGTLISAGPMEGKQSLFFKMM